MKLRLIATDLDGTLLTTRGELPEGVFDVVTPICERGVLFIPASGRQYESLRQMFAPLAEKTVFLCENGALVKYLGRSIYLNALDPAQAKRVIDAARNTPNVFPMYCGEQTAFVENDYQPFFSRVAKAYPAHRLVDCLDEVIGVEPCCKISLFSTESAEAQAYTALAPVLGNEVSFTLSGRHWCDVAAKTANKGSALQEIQRIFGIRQDECAAFGDHMNDRQMFEVCTHTFAPENAYPPIKALAKTIIPSNVEGGVLLTLKALFDEGAFL